MSPVSWEQWWKNHDAVVEVHSQRGEKLEACWPEVAMPLAPQAKASKRHRYSFKSALEGHWQKEVWLIRHKSLAHLCLFSLPY